MDWWVGTYSYDTTFTFGLKSNDNNSDLDANLGYLNAPVGVWLKFDVWITNTWFDFVTYNIDNRFLIGEAAAFVNFKGPIVPHINLDMDDDSTEYTSTDTNIDDMCVQFGTMINLLTNTYTSYSNAKTCRKSWMKLIANDFKMDDKVCAFSYDTEGAIEDDYLSENFWEYLIVDVLDGDQADYDELFGTQNFGDDWYCLDSAADWFSIF